MRLDKPGVSFRVRPDRVITRSISVSDQSALLLKGLAVSRVKKRNDRGALVSMAFETAGGEVSTAPPGLGLSADHGIYSYVAVRKKKKKGESFNIVILPPPGTTKIFLNFSCSFIEKPIGFFRVSVAALPGDVLDHRSVLTEKFLRDYVSMMRQNGDIGRRFETLTAAYSKYGQKEYLAAANITKGEVRELDPIWEPRVSLVGKPVPDRNVVCHLHKVAIPYENSGGAVRNANTMQSQKSVGLDPFVVMPLGYPDGGADWVDLEQYHDGVPYYFNIPNQRTVGSLPNDVALQLDAQLTAEVAATKAPSIVHAASGFRGYELALKAIPIARCLGIPLVYEVRSLHEHLWRDGASLEAELTRLRMKQEDRCMHAANAVVTISDEMRRLFVARGVDDSKISVIPNAVASGFLQSPCENSMTREKLGFSGSETVGYISNFSRREGHEILIRAVAKLIDRRKNLKCILVGDGKTRDACEKFAEELGIRESIAFVGEVSHKDITAYYRAIDVFVVPRVADYAADYVTPLKPFEAMALGVPIIMSDRPAASEVIGNDERGLTFRTGDVEDLIRKIETLLNHRDQAKIMTQRGQAWIKENRTWEANARRYKALYRELQDGHEIVQAKS
ncbi:MAG: glycosyltransferase [Gammaproteobacteria bacterium]|nr:glycosyltransferase [Gammaproteobacteria bacterium]